MSNRVAYQCPVDIHCKVEKQTINRKMNMKIGNSSFLILVMFGWEECMLIITYIHSSANPFYLDTLRILVFYFSMDYF